MATVTLAETVSPKRKDIANAVVSLIPQPPMLTGRVIENNIIGAKTKKLLCLCANYIIFNDSACKHRRLGY